MTNRRLTLSVRSRREHPDRANQTVILYNYWYNNRAAQGAKVFESKTFYWIVRSLLQVSPRCHPCPWTGPPFASSLSL